MCVHGDEHEGTRSAIVWLADVFLIVFMATVSFGRPSGHILQYASQHAFLAILIHNPLRSLYQQEGQSSSRDVMMK